MKAPLIYHDESSGQTVRAGAFDRHVMWVLWAVAGVLIIGTIIDLGILWFVQRRAGPQWEFVAIVNTLESVTRPALGLGFLYLGLYFGHSGSRLAYRALGLCALLLGLAAGGLGGLLLTDYFVLSRAITEGSVVTFESTAWKGMALSGIAFLLFVPIGIFGLRGPREG